MKRTLFSIALVLCVGAIALVAQDRVTQGDRVTKADRPTQKDTRRRFGQIATRAAAISSASGMPSIDNDRDVPLGSALRDGAHVDIGRAESVEHLGGDTRGACHAIAHRRENRQVRIDLDVLDLLAVWKRRLTAKHARRTGRTDLSLQLLARPHDGSAVDENRGDLVRRIEALDELVGHDDRPSG